MSIRIQYPLVVLTLFCFLSASIVSWAGDPINVQVQDSSTEALVPCGDVKLLEIGDTLVKLITEGESCLDSGISPVTTPVLPESLPQLDIDEASVRYIDLGAKATVKLDEKGSVYANVGLTSDKGGVISLVADSSVFPGLVGSVIKYTAPTVGEGGVDDSFSYGLTDANAASGFVGKVTIKVRDVPVTLPPEGSCTPGGGLNCPGDLNEMDKFPSGLILGQKVAAGEIDAWRFTYLKTNVSPPESPRPGTFIVFDGTGKEVSISSVAGDMGPEETDGTIAMDGYPCARWLPNEYSLYFNLADSAAANECPLKEGGVYYLNIRNREGQVPDYRLDISEG